MQSPPSGCARPPALEPPLDLAVDEDRRWPQAEGGGHPLRGGVVGVHMGDDPADVAPASRCSSTSRGGLAGDAPALPRACRRPRPARPTPSAGATRGLHVPHGRADGTEPHHPVVPHLVGPARAGDLARVPPLERRRGWEVSRR